MTADSVRNQVKIFLQSNDLMTQNKVARLAQIPKSTFSDFMKRHTDLSKMQLKAIVKVVNPDLFNARLVGAQLRVTLIKRGFTSHELTKIAAEIGKPEYVTEA